MAAADGAGSIPVVPWPGCLRRSFVMPSEGPQDLEYYSVMQNTRAKSSMFSLRAVALVGLVASVVCVLAGAFLSGPVLIFVGIGTALFFGDLAFLRPRIADAFVSETTTRRNSIIGLIIFSATGVASIFSLSNLVRTLTDQGLLADANGTSGYTTDAEIVSGLCAVFSILLSLFVLPILTIRLVKSSRNLSVAE